MSTKPIAKSFVVVAVSAAIAAPVVAPWAQSNRPVTNFTYDANGNLTSSTDVLGRATVLNYDTLNRLTKITQPKPVSTAPNPITQFGFNGLDQLTAVTDPRNLVTGYTVSGLGDLTQQASPDTGTTINTYDAAGNLKTSKDARGYTTTYTYDGINRLTQAKYGDGTITSYYYDEGSNGVGRLTRMVDPGPITTTWTYTTQGRVANKSQVVSAGGANRTHTLQYAYNPTTGQLTSITYPSGRVIGLQYGLTSKAVETLTVDGQPAASSVTYHAFGGIKRMTLRNGIVWSSTIDQDGRTTSHTLGGVAYSIQWDAANRITAITHPTDTNWSRGYAYDGLDRVASFTSTPRDQTFNYDATGNLLSKMDRVGANAPFTHTYNIAAGSNRMTGISNLGIGYTIDAAGNRTADSTTTWVVNARGRVSQVRIISGATTYTYNHLLNGLNQRIRKTGPSTVVPSGTQVFVYDEAGRLIGEYDNLGRAKSEHVWLADRPVALIVYTYSGTSITPLTTTHYSVEADHLGTPRLITDSAQAKRWYWHDAPYGDTLPNEKPGAPAALVYNLRFPGQYFDKETNLAYNWHRDYEATTGRYIQSDPIGLRGGINTYAYVGGSPTAYTDPFGLWSTEVHNQIIRAQFSGKLAPYLIEAIIEGSARVDAVFNQLPYIGNDYEHAMRARGQSVADAKAKACRFIRSHMAEYRKYSSYSQTIYKRRAYVHLGMALHTIMDSTSPEHEGYQEWHMSNAKRHGDFKESRENWISDVDLKRTLELIDRALAGDECACAN
jgi:RHS repeat-associated protein